MILQNKSTRELEMNRNNSQFVRNIPCFPYLRKTRIRQRHIWTQKKHKKRKPLTSNEGNTRTRTHWLFSLVSFMMHEIVTFIFCFLKVLLDMKMEEPLLTWIQRSDDQINYSIYSWEISQNKKPNVSRRFVIFIETQSHVQRTRPTNGNCIFSHLPQNAFCAVRRHAFD